jgi:Mn-containing catalase
VRGLVGQRDQVPFVDGDLGIREGGADTRGVRRGRVDHHDLDHLSDGVKDVLKFLLARDTMHQNQWIAAIRELQDEGTEKMPVPSNFPQREEHREYSYQYWKNRSMRLGTTCSVSTAADGG